MEHHFQHLLFLTGFHLFMWAPYIINMILRLGFWDAVSYDDFEPRMDEWAERMKKAHYNAVENYVIYATLVLVANLTGTYTDTFQYASISYVFIRMLHYILYTIAFPLGRTLTFLAGIGALGVMLTQVWQ